MNNRRIAFRNRMSKIWKLTKHYRLTFLNLAICDIIAPIINMAYPLLFALLIDEVFNNRNMDYFIIILILYGVIYISSTLLYMIQRITLSELLTRYINQVREKLFLRLIHSKGKILSNTNTGDDITVINNDVGEIINFIHLNLFYPISSIMRLLLTIYITATLSYWLAVLMIIVVSISVFISLCLSKRVKKAQNRYREEYGRYMGWLYEVIKGMRDIRLNSGKKTITLKICEYLISLTEKKTKVSIIELIAERLVSFVTLLSNLSLYVLAAIMIINEQITLGMFIIIVDYFANANKFLRNLSSVYTSVQKNFVSIDRVLSLMENEIEDNQKEDISITNGNIVFSDISFKYQEKNNYVLHNLNLKIRSGEKIAIVGKSGAGKSTLINLLTGLFNLESGAIYIDDKNLAHYSYSSIRKSIGVVQQDILIFNGTIRENILIEKSEEYDEGQIWHACEKANIAEYIRTLPEQLDTKIGLGDGYSSLSGGQKQRISIARIFLKNPPLLVFDESTSSLDNISEQVIYKSIDELSSERTTIIIAHRLSSITYVDKIAFLKNEKIIALDTHENLLNECEAYQELFYNQYAIEEKV